VVLSSTGTTLPFTFTNVHCGWTKELTSVHW